MQTRMRCKLIPSTQHDLMMIATHASEDSKQEEEFLTESVELWRSHCARRFESSGYNSKTNKKVVALNKKRKRKGQQQITSFV